VQDPLGKLLALVVGGAMVLGFGWLGVDSFQEYRRFDDAPMRTDLAHAVAASSDGRRWVTIEGAPWRCDRLVRNIDGGVAFLPATAEDGSLVVARFDHAIRCAEVAAGPLTGVLEPMTPRRAADLRGGGLVVPGGADLRTFDVCAFCGKGNSRLGIVVCACFVLLGLFIYPLRLAFQSLRGRALGALRGAIHAVPEQEARANRVVRVWGASLLVAAAFCETVGRGYVIYGIVPVPWFGVFAGLLGVWMAVFPASYRRRSRPRR
jgi:hypothetical protein